MYASGSPISLLFIPDTAASATSTTEGGAALLVGEADGFAADFTYPIDGKRVAVKAGGLRIVSQSSKRNPNQRGQ